MNRALQLEYYGEQVLGGRNEQQDAFAVNVLDASTMLVAVADGVGGSPGGDKAAQAAVAAAIESYDSGLEPDELFAAIVQAATLSVSGVQKSHSAHTKAATTLVVCLVQRGFLSWASVGDSPLFLFRKGKLRRLNADHSASAVLQQLEKSPRLQRSNVLMSSIDGSPPRFIDLNAKGLKYPS